MHSCRCTYFMINACVWCENQNHALFFIWFGFENKKKTHFLVPFLSLLSFGPSGSPAGLCTLLSSPLPLPSLAQSSPAHWPSPVLLSLAHNPTNQPFSQPSSLALELQLMGWQLFYFNNFYLYQALVRLHRLHACVTTTTWCSIPTRRTARAGVANVLATLYWPMYVFPSLCFFLCTLVQ